MFTLSDIENAVFETDKGTIVSLEVSAGVKNELFPAGYNPWRKAIGIQVKAQAIEGKANKAIISLVASKLLLPKTSIQIISGQTSSNKRILLEGISSQSVITTLATLINAEE